MVTHRMCTVYTTGLLLTNMIFYFPSSPKCAFFHRFNNAPLYDKNILPSGSNVVKYIVGFLLYKTNRNNNFKYKQVKIQFLISWVFSIFFSKFIIFNDSIDCFYRSDIHVTPNLNEGVLFTL